MKSFLLFILLAVIVAGAIYYFAPWQKWSVLDYFSASSSILGDSASTSTASNGAVALGDQAMKSVAGAEAAVQGFVNNSGQVLGAAVTNLVGNTVTNAENSAKEAVVQQVADVLGVSTTVTGTTAPTSVTISDISNSGFEVCSAHAKGETVGYLLEFATSSSATEYIVDWGDGQTTQNSASAGAPSVLVAHSYSTDGSYEVTFRLSGSSTILAQKEVCVQ